MFGGLSGNSRNPRSKDVFRTQDPPVSPDISIYVDSGFNRSTDRSILEKVCTSSPACLRVFTLANNCAQPIFFLNIATRGSRWVTLSSFPGSCRKSGLRPLKLDHCSRGGLSRNPRKSQLDKTPVPILRVPRGDTFTPFRTCEKVPSRFR